MNYRPCILPDESELRLSKQSRPSRGHYDDDPPGYWTFEHRGADWELIAESTFRADMTSSRLDGFSASGRRCLVRFSMGELFVYDADTKRSASVACELPAPGPFWLGGDAVICEDGKSVILWDGEAGKLRKLRLFADGE